MRESGYYKILAKAKPGLNPQRQHLDTWFIGYYDMNSKQWTMCGRTSILYDSDLVKVDENRIKMPDEENQSDADERSVATM